MATSVSDSAALAIASLVRDNINEASLELSKQIVQAFRDAYVEPLLANLRSRGVVQLIARKNPYLYRASGLGTCEELVQRAFLDYLSSSTETLFGNFLERVALLMSGGYKSATKGVDIEKRIGNRAELYVVKSGPAAFNAGSRRDAERALNEAAKRLLPAGIEVHRFIAFAYGRKRTTYERGVTILSSSEFWNRISGIRDFHIRLLEICGYLAPLYGADLDAARQRLLEEAKKAYCAPSGEIRWDTVVRLSFDSAGSQRASARRG